MRRFLLNLALCIVFLPGLVRAQGGVVSAPVLESLETANKATLIKQLAEAMKQTGVLADTYEKLKKSVEIYYQVSDALQTVELVSSVINKQIDLVNMCSKALKDIKDVKGASQESITRVQRNITKVVDGYKQNLDLIKKTLSSDNFKMDDKGRIDLLMSIDEKTETAMHKVNSYYSAFAAVTTAKKTVKAIQ